MHPSDGQIKAFARRTLDPAELLQVGDHLAGCDACRTRAATRVRVGEALGDLRSGLLPPESHLSDAQVGEFVEGVLDARQRAKVELHLRACPPCAREVAELETWARTRRRPRWAAYAAAAAAVLFAVLVPVASRWRSQDALAGLDALPREQQQRVRAALEAGVAEPPAFLADLAGSPETLMGAAPAGSFRLIEPLGTVAVSDRPTFRWEPLAGAEAYTVAVFVGAMRRVAESPPVTETAWTPAQPLPRGAVYAWQVTARRGQRSVTAPAPPAPIARLRVLDEGTARTLSTLAREHPGSHLLLGILHAQAGARAEADLHLAQVPPTDRYFEVARRTRERMKPRFQSRLR